MKLSLMVTQGSTQGKFLSITVPQFVIGRDPQCHLRPVSPMISKRHCALLIRDGKAYVRDFDSTNGTFVNEVQVKGVRELVNKDMLKIGPLSFEVRVETPAPAVDKPTPLPAQKTPAPRAADEVHDDESIADMLLDMQDDPLDKVDLAAPSEDLGSTVLDIPALAAASAAPEPKPPAKASGKKPANQSSTQSAAQDLLNRLQRRTRK